MLDKIEIRSATASDMPFIYATWLKGLYYGNVGFEDMDKATFFGTYHKLIEKWAQVDRLKVACLSDEPDVILGYACISNSKTVRWVFVKRSWRRMGVAKALLSDVTHCTALTDAGKAANKGRLKYDPFL